MTVRLRNYARMSKLSCLNKETTMGCGGKKKK